MCFVICIKECLPVVHTLGRGYAFAHRRTMHLISVALPGKKGLVSYASMRSYLQRLQVSRLLLTLAMSCSKDSSREVGSEFR